MAEPIDHVLPGYHYEPEAQGHDTPCWIWRLSRALNGYGRLVRRGHTVMAHRWVYERLRGPIPEGLTLDHLCRVPACVNPDHLEPVTVRENIMRGGGASAQNAQKTHCVNGHEFTPENTGHDGRGRVCLTCNRESSRARYSPVEHVRRACAYCGASFMPKRKDTIYCSKRCGRQARYERERSR